MMRETIRSTRETTILLIVFLVLKTPWAAGAAGPAGSEMVANGSFENGFEGWTRWGKNADLIKLESGSARSGTNCAHIQHGHNALYFVAPLTPRQAYELKFFYRPGDETAIGQVALGFSVKGGALRSAGFKTFRFTTAASLPRTLPGSAESPSKTEKWREFRQVFLPTPTTANCQFAFTALEGSVWIDDVSLRMVPRPEGLAEPLTPWDGLKHRTAKPLFKELLTQEPGGYTVVSWAHDLNPKDKNGFKSEELKDNTKWQRAALAIMKETGEAGMGFLDLPGRLDEKEPWRTAEFHREQFRKYGVRYDVFSEGSPSIAAGLKNGAELLNPAAKNLGGRPSVSWVDTKYVEAQEGLLRKLAKQLRGEPFVGYWYGKDEPTIHLPEGNPERWGEYGRMMAKEVRDRYGSGRFEAPRAQEKDFNDPKWPLRWIAYNRWMNDKFVESRGRLSRALHEADPGARYSPANYWFMSGFVPYDYSRLAAGSDLMELDPYASSAEQRRGRGVFNHGFGAKFMSDLTDKPVRIVVQAFDYAGYEMRPEDLREWVSQSLRGGASAIDYYEMDSPRWTQPARWKMMLHLSSVITRMNRIKLPQTADTAVLYTLYTHMSHGASTAGDQVYSVHALLGELAGSWFRFVSDAQLERGEKTLKGYKAVYLPLAKYMTPQATSIIEDYVRAGGVLICGDAEAFASDLAGNDSRAARERILGLKTRGPKSANKITFPSATWGLPARATLPLFDIKLWEETAPGRARSVEIIDRKAEVLAVYPDGSPAIVSHRLGKGCVITFAANPFAPQVAVDETLWPQAFKGLQKSLGCSVDQPIWRFVLPAEIGR